MRVSVLILVLLFGVAGDPAISHAEKVKTNQPTKLYARPGERAKVLLKVDEGKAMTVIAKEGRWLKVRVSGRTGFVARSTVDMPGGDEIARNTRRRPFVDGRSVKRGFGSDEAPDDRVGADAVGEGQEDGGDDDAGDEDADEDADEDVKKPVAKVTKPTTKPTIKPSAAAVKPTPKAAAVKPKITTKPAADDDDEDPLGGDEGDADADEDAGDEDAGDEDAGEEVDTRKKVRVAAKTPVYSDPDAKSEQIYVAKAGEVLFPTGEKNGKYTEVENEEGDLGYVLSSSLDVQEKSAPPAIGGGRGSSQIDMRVRLGVSFLSQALRTPGGVAGVPNNYNISTAAATLALGGGYYRPYKSKFVVGTELTYDYAKAIPGIKTPMDKTTSISLHNLNVRGIFGIDFRRKSGMMLLGRVGLHYQSFQVAKAVNLAENTATLPSEIMIAPKLGVALAMPRLSNKLGLRFSLDAMLFTASYKQTKNLEDGKSPAAKGATVGAGLTYRWKPSMDIQATYDLMYTKATFGDKVDSSQRMHPEGGVQRTDVFHAVTAGIVKAF